MLALESPFVPTTALIRLPNPHGFAPRIDPARVTPPVESEHARSRASGTAPQPRAPRTMPDLASAGPMVLATIAYPNLRGLAFAAQMLAQRDNIPATTADVAARAYAQPAISLTGFLGLLDPFDLSI